MLFSSTVIIKQIVGKEIIRLTFELCKCISYSTSYEIKTNFNFIFNIILVLTVMYLLVYSKIVTWWLFDRSVIQYVFKHVFFYT